MGKYSRSRQVSPSGQVTETRWTTDDSGRETTLSKTVDGKETISRHGGGVRGGEGQGEQTPQVQQPRVVSNIGGTKALVTQQFLEKQRQQQQLRQPLQFTGVVEQRSASEKIGGGVLEERRFLQQGRQVAEESQLTRQLPVERQGRVSSFVVQQTPRGEVRGIQETRQSFIPAQSQSTVSQSVKDIVGGGEPMSYTPEGIIEKRRELPPFERIKIAYMSASPKKEEGYISVRGGIRAYLEAVDIAVGPALKRMGLQGPVVSTRIPEDIAISTFMLSPTSSTTAQIERELFSINKVQLAGVTQSVGENKVITDAFFRVSRAGRNVKGIVSSESVNVGQQGQLTNVITGSKGGTFVRGLSFPSGKEIIKKISSFRTGELGQVASSESGNLFLTRGIGATKTGLKLEKYASVGVGQQTKNLIAQIGITQSEKGASVSVGLLKIKSGDLSTTFKNVFGYGGGGNLKQIVNTNQNALKVASLSATKSSVSANIIIPQQQIFNILPVVSASSIEKITTPSITSAAIKNIQITPSIQTTKQETDLGNAWNTASRFSQYNIVAITPKPNQVQRARPSQQTKQIDLTKTLQKSLSVQKSIQAQRTQQRTLTLQKNINKLKPMIKFRTPQIKIKTPIPFKLLFGDSKAQKGYGGTKLFVKEKGQFKFKGAFANPMKALNMGRFLTGKDINRSFKIEGAKVGLPSGYRRSKKKGMGNVFVELPKTALSQVGEQATVKFFKGLKGGSRKKRR